MFDFEDDCFSWEWEDNSCCDSENDGGVFNE